ncbi:alkaline-phosphatase-like protein [Lipomyces japonicus]|uniref:alkaline-phosphatase-like protein n=1 Tax=Lipomyces japonicus TaxID=56871 RepID=UPI0034CFAB4B
MEKTDFIADLREDDSEDITGDYDVHDFDKNILSRHDTVERLIVDATKKSDSRGRYNKLNSRSTFALNNIDDDEDEDEDEELDAEAHLKYLRKKRRRWNFIKGFFFYLLFSLVLAIIGGAIYVGVMKFDKIKDKILKGSSKSSSKILLTNGTHEFYSTTILISLDGFRPAYLSPEITPTMHGLFSSGFSTPFMYPSFPSVTFPNHYTIVTGLYPSSHGIVGNTFWDPEFEEGFNYHDPKVSLDPKWWKGEPLWVTATKNGLNAAVHMWPGSEVSWGRYQPNIVDKFNQTETLDKKVSRVLGWLDFEIDSRPEIIFCYVPTIDSLGHKYGIEGPEINIGLSQVDGMVSSILNGINDRNLTSVVNVVIVSDHGMAPTSNERLIFLDDFLTVEDIEHNDGWPLYGLRPHANVSTKEVFAEIKASRADVTEHGGEAKDNLDHWKVYFKDDLPVEYHFGGPSGGMYQDRIAPIWLVPEAGWAFTTHEKFETNNYDFRPKGLHGFNNTHPLMRSLFIAKGPHFESDFKAEPFYNVEIYDIICASLNITGAPNNGTLNGELIQLPQDWIDEAEWHGIEIKNDEVLPTTAVLTFSTTISPSAPKHTSMQPELDSISDEINRWLDAVGESDRKNDDI